MVKRMLAELKVVRAGGIPQVSFACLRAGMTKFKAERARSRPFGCGDLGDMSVVPVTEVEGRMIILRRDTAGITGIMMQSGHCRRPASWGRWLRQSPRPANIHRKTHINPWSERLDDYPCTTTHRLRSGS